MGSLDHPSTRSSEAKSLRMMRLKSRSLHKQHLIGQYDVACLNLVQVETAGNCVTSLIGAVPDYGLLARFLEALKQRCNFLA